MAHRAELLIESEKRDLLTFGLNYFEAKYLSSLASQDITLDELREKAETTPYIFSSKKGGIYGGTIDLMMESSGEDEWLFDWFRLDGGLTSLKHGRIDIFDEHDEYMPVKRIEFWDAWITNIEESMSTTGTKPMTLTMRLSSATIRYNGEITRKSWYITDPEKIVDKAAKEEQELFVCDIKWRGRKKGRERKDMMLNHKITLEVEVRNYYEGETFELTVKQSNGRRIKGNSTEFTVTGTVNDSNIVMIENFNVECDFAEDNQDFGNIEFYHKGRKVAEFKENFGWTYIKEGHLLKIFCNIELNVNYVAMGCTEGDYKDAVNNQFRRTLELSSDGLVTGKLFFDGICVNDPPQVVPKLSIIAAIDVAKGEASTGTNTIANISNVESMREDNSFLLLDLGEGAVHELLHTLRLEHPFSKTQAEDTKLINLGWERLKTTPTTDPNIYYNILNYNFKIIDGKLLGDLWKFKRPEYITKGQLQFIFDEIDRQQNGEGTTQDVIEATYERSEWDIYWDPDNYHGKPLEYQRTSLSKD